MLTRGADPLLYIGGKKWAGRKDGKGRGVEGNRLPKSVYEHRHHRQFSAGNNNNLICIAPVCAKRLQWLSFCSVSQLSLTMTKRTSRPRHCVSSQRQSYRTLRLRHDKVNSFVIIIHHRVHSLTSLFIIYLVRSVLYTDHVKITEVHKISYLNKLH